ncbi:MAG: IMP dehydrogenase [Nanoarchaeota archaeon]|nr:IMP dehydrogenase [Nanoarchaeota archaeon]
MAKEIKLGLSYDDVLVVPQYSEVFSRKQVDTSTRLTQNIKINNPIVSANMDTVTESSMAISIARLGGIGIIHRFLTVEDQVKEVLKVKRSESIMIEKPYSIPPSKTISEAQEFIKKVNVSGILVTNENNHLVGILTSRDLLFEEDLDRQISEIMTPRKKIVTAPIGTTLKEAKKILHKHKVEKLPIVDSCNVLQGLITSSDITKRDKFPAASKDKKGKLLVGAAIGVKGDYLDRAKALIDAGCDVLVIDIAHGHLKLALDTVEKVKEMFDVDIIAGNVATPEGTGDLIKAGADAIKVGVGPGSSCITRIITGSGIPQVSAIMRCSEVASELNIPVIADGGIKVSGDIVKAIVAGAESIMVGNLLGGTDESPGRTIIKNGKRFKIYRGMASFGANLGRKERLKSNSNLADYTPEGVEALVPYRGSCAEVLGQLLGGLRSGMSYSGAHTIEELRRKGYFVRITSGGLVESKPHDLNVL